MDPSSAATPLTLRARPARAHEDSPAASPPAEPPCYRPSALEESEIQHILGRIKARRLEQGLPPFFGILTGPSLGVPFRLEQLQVALGRVSSTSHAADVHVSASPLVSHRHLSLEFSKRDMLWYAINLSKNGSLVKSGTSRDWVALEGPGAKVALGNPAAFNLAGTIVYWQLFYVADAPSDPWVTYDDSADGSAPTGASTPGAVKPGNRATALRLGAGRQQPGRKPDKAAVRRKRNLADISALGHDPRALEDASALQKGAAKKPGEAGLPAAGAEPTSPVRRPRGPRPKTAEIDALFVPILVRALGALGGCVSQKEIGEWILENRPDVTVKSTWKTAVSNILSNNPLFQPEIVTKENGKKARWARWSLRTPSKEHHHKSKDGTPLKPKEKLKKSAPPDDHFSSDQSTFDQSASSSSLSLSDDAPSSPTRVSPNPPPASAGHLNHEAAGVNPSSEHASASTSLPDESEAIMLLSRLTNDRPLEDNPQSSSASQTIANLSPSIPSLRDDAPALNDSFSSSSSLS